MLTSKNENVKPRTSLRALYVRLSRQQHELGETYAEIASALDEQGADDLVAHSKIPVPVRVSCAAAASGEVDGAKKIGRRWIAPRSSWGAWLSRRAAEQAPTPSNDIASIVDRVVAGRRAGR